MAAEDISIRLVGLSIQPAAVVSARPPVAIGIVTLSGEAPDGGLTVELSSDNPAIAEVPPRLEVPEGVNAGFFEVTVNAVDQPTNLSISASYQGVTTSAQLTVLPVAADHPMSADDQILS